MLYAAYGSNLDAQKMASTCPYAALHGTGWLPGLADHLGGEGWDLSAAQRAGVAAGIYIRSIWTVR